MNYNLKATDVTLTDEIRGYLEKKLTHLEKFVHKASAARADVELEYMPSQAKMYRAEVMLHEPSLKQPMRAEATGGTLYEAIDIMAGDIASELTRSKKKRITNFRQSALRVKDYLRGWRDNV